MKEATSASISLTTLFEDVAEMAWDVKDAAVASSLTGWYDAVVTYLEPAWDDSLIGLNDANLAWLGSACLDVKEAVVASLTGLYDAMYPIPLVLSVQLERAGVEMLAGMRTTIMKEATSASISLTMLFEDVAEMAWEVKDAAVASSLTGWYNAVVTCLVPALDDCLIRLNDANLAWLGSACLDVKEAVVASLTGLYDAMYPIPLVLSLQLERAGVEMLAGMRTTIMKEATSASISLTTLFEDVAEMAWHVKDAAVASSLTRWYDAVVTYLEPAWDDSLIRLNDANLAWLGSACLDVKEAVVASLTGLYDAMFPIPLVLSVQLERAGVEMLAGMRTTIMKEATSASISLTTLFEDVAEMAWDVKDAAVASSLTGWYDAVVTYLVPAWDDSLIRLNDANLAWLGSACLDVKEAVVASLTGLYDAMYPIPLVLSLQLERAGVGCWQRTTMMKEATNASISLTTLFEDVAEMAWDVKDAAVASSLTGWYDAVVTYLVPALDDCLIGLNDANLAWLGSACLDVKEAVVASLTGLYDAMYPIPLVLSLQLERAGVEMLAGRGRP